MVLMLAYVLVLRPIDLGLVLATLGSEPGEHIGVDANRHLLFHWAVKHANDSIALVGYLRHVFSTENRSMGSAPSARARLDRQLPHHGAPRQ